MLEAVVYRRDRDAGQSSSVFVDGKGEMFCSSCPLHNNSKGCTGTCASIH